jgi:tetrahydromethanopterin S-methyltransferase subunit G
MRTPIGRVNRPGFDAAIFCEKDSQPEGGRYGMRRILESVRRHQLRALRAQLLGLLGQRLGLRVSFMPSVRLLLNAPKVQLSVESDEIPRPTEQLKFIHAEVDRQRAAIAARRNAMHTRAAVLVTASGILATIQATSLANGWQFISIGLALVAATVGLWTMWPASGDESDPRDLFENYLTAEPYSVENRIVEDNVRALTGEMTLLDKIGTRLGIGYCILLGMWLSMVVISALRALTWI